MHILNKHTRLAVTILFAVFIILAVTVTRVYFTSPDYAGSKSTQDEIVRRLDVDESGNRIFEDSTGHYGVSDSGDRIIVAPEWNSLEFAGKGKCIASGFVGGKRLTGCIDYDGNIAVPFIYEGIRKTECGESTFFIAHNQNSDEYVIYDDSFSPCFRRTWKNCETGSDEIRLFSDKGEYVYTAGRNGFICKNASVKGETLGCEYQTDVYSRIILSKLSPDVLEKLTGDVGVYLKYAYTGNDDVLSEITLGSRNGFQELFSDDHRVLTKKLRGISNIYIYSKKTDNGTLLYTVSVSADTEITYTDDMGERKTLRDKYEATVDFSGYTENSLTAVSGKFTQTEPDYPVPEELLRLQEHDDTADISAE